ncbi:hypothetical protein [Streptomyces sp. NPDC058622]|uniref:hypothetical protein n=1 Tax=unclassified Streptomyces TaxID=2593676 RepID=UPI003652A10C
MSELLPLCDDITKRSAIEAAFLDGLEEPAHEPVESLACELQRGHEGIHFALAQGDGEKLRWLVWAPRDAPLTIRGEQTGRRLYPMPACPATDPEDPEGECTLARSHKGGRSFEMEPAGPRTSSRLMRRRIAAELRAETGPERLPDDHRGPDEQTGPGPAPDHRSRGRGRIITGLLRMYAETEWLVEDHTEELLTRIQHRLNALNPTAH